MSCYCREIRKCSNDIIKIRSARRYLEEACQCNEGKIKCHLMDLETNYNLCITPENIAVLSDNVLRSNDSVRQNVENLLKACDSEILQLESKLIRMEYMDDRYHESDDDD